MSHGTSHHPQLLKYSLDFKSLKVQEAALTLPRISSVEPVLHGRRSKQQTVQRFLTTFM